MKPIIKWPGGKSREFDKIKNLIPQHSRYIEPFFGGGAVFFKLMPSNAKINDISSSLMYFYELVKEQNKEFKDILLTYDSSFQSLIYNCDLYHNKILDAFYNNDVELIDIIKYVLSKSKIENELVLDLEVYSKTIIASVLDKFERTRQNNIKRKFSEEDLLENLITGFTSGFYLYFRNLYNDINLNRIEVSIPFKIANFYFIREYCYGSMFRYNKKGEFNIPYGGMSYNRKQFIKKIDSIFNTKTESLFKGTEIYNLDFEVFLDKINLTTDDFIFLDPPYDTDFSDYEGKSFDLNDQVRLCNYLKNIPSKFILIIKNTDFIYNLYKSDFEILSFEKNYTYNVRSRNERKVTHLIIKNF